MANLGGYIYIYIVDVVVVVVVGRGPSKITTKTGNQAMRGKHGRAQCVRETPTRSYCWHKEIPRRHKCAHPQNKLVRLCGPQQYIGDITYIKYISI